MSGNDKRREAAKIIAIAVKQRRLDKQYQCMIDWRDGRFTGLEAIDEIVNLEHLVEVTQSDFRPPSTPLAPEVK
jgi:hypothetical protein